MSDEQAKARNARYLTEQAATVGQALESAGTVPECCSLCGGKVRFGRCRGCGADYTVRPARPAGRTLDEIDHSQCAPAAHDRSLPDDGGRLHADLYDEHGFLSDKQVMTPDGLLGCNDCGRPMFYCTNAEWYFHVDPDAGCFLAAPWRRE